MVDRQTKKLATARRIRQQAGQLFLQRGVDRVSVEDIAAAAGVSRASLFNYYRGKVAILKAMAEELEPRLLKLLDHYLSKPLDTPSRLRQLFAYTGRVLAQTAPLTRLMFVHGSGGGGFPALEREFVRLASIGHRQGDLRDDLTAAELGSTMYLAFVAGVLGWLQDEPSGGQGEPDADGGQSRPGGRGGRHSQGNPDNQGGQTAEAAMLRRADTLIKLVAP